MNQTQCNALRDLLFAARFDTGYKEDVFRFLAVLPGGEGGGAATVHYAYAPPVWTRAGETTDAVTLVRGLIAKTDFANERIDLQFHDYLRNGWSLPWDLTAKSSNDDFPTLVLIELPGGVVTGVLMRDPHTGRTIEKIAEASAEPDEADTTLSIMRALPVNSKYMSWYKDSNIDAPSLDDAIAMTPETVRGQKALLLYRDAEWLTGLWNNPDKHPSSSGPCLSSVADFHGTRVSAAKRATRAGLAVARESQTIQGDSQVLGAALALLPKAWKPGYMDDHESQPAVELLCAWWNANAPSEMRHAGLFRTYIWAEADLVFMPGDPEEPAVQVSQLAKEGVFALFEQEGRPAVAIQFHRGRAANTPSNYGGTQTYLANGAEAADIGLDMDEVNEAYYSVLGLQSVRSHWR
jgi:hypothetical protein